MHHQMNFALAVVGTPGKQMTRWPTFQIAAIIISFFFLVAVIELIRRHRLKEKYSILWLFSAVVLLVFSSWRGLLHKTSRLLGVDYPPSLLFMFAFVFLLFIVFHFSTVISKESDRSKTLAQRIGLLENKIEELRKELEEKKKT